MGDVLKKTVESMNSLSGKLRKLWALLSLLPVLAVAGCAANTPETEPDDVGAVVIEEEEQAPEQAVDDEQAAEPEPPAGELTESGFPNAEATGVISKFSEIAPSVVKVGDEFSYGTGWVLDANHVLTNWHVVDFMSEPITMETYDGQLLYGSVIATEEFDDIAVIRLDQPTSLTPLPLASSPAVTGDPVFYIGHPGTIGDWITGVGVVAEPDEFWPDFVRSTLPTDQGASGSAMMNLQGEVVALISGCMGLADPSERLIGDGNTLYSASPAPDISDSCGGTEITKVKAFADAAIGSAD